MAGTQATASRHATVAPEVREEQRRLVKLMVTCTLQDYYRDPTDWMAPCVKEDPQVQANTASLVDLVREELKLRKAL
jgi:hypothetical protein